MKIYQNGISAYMGGSGDHVRAPRGVVRGWSKASVRRHRQWAWSIDHNELGGFGYAVTLTMDRTPHTAAEFVRLRTAWLMRIERMGALRTHWVVEWQERGTPHIHAAIYFEDALTPLQQAMLVGHWVSIAAPAFGALIWAQDVKRIDGSLGWLKYLAKHATRGMAHYQRQGHPEGWEKTGQLWGRRGEWPEHEPMVLDQLNVHEFWRMRRIARAWAVADARKRGDWKRVHYLRSSGRPNNARESRFMGVAEWLPEDVLLRLVDLFERENR
jgi:hypothetical protein